MVITSINNEKIKNLCKLHMKKYRDEEEKFLIEGDHLVKEAIKSNNLLELILLEDNKLDISFDNITYVTKEVMDKLSEQDSSTNVIGICKYINNNDNLNNKLILLDGLQDPGNVGTIIRSAVAFNYDVILGDNTVDIYNSKTIRSTEGMIFNVNFIKSNLVDFIKNNNNYNYYIADMNKGKELKDIDKDNKVAVIVGNEGNGVSSGIRNLNLNYLHIKQNSKCESLNVGVASSIIMYEIGDANE